jgi:hypothetical protein
VRLRLGDRPEQLALDRAGDATSALIARALGLTLIARLVRTSADPVLYLAAFVWENVMLAKPEPTRTSCSA